jgi:hypothetical protein
VNLTANEILFYPLKSAPNSLMRYKRFLQLMSEPENIVSISRNIAIFGSFSSCLDKGESVFKPVFSRFFKKFNVLKLSNGKEALFIFQSRTSCDAIYIPSQSAVISLRYFSENEHDVILPMVIDYDSQYIDSGNNPFHGFIAMNGRPSHFFYNVAPLVGTLPKGSKIYKIKGADFSELSGIFPEKNFIEKQVTNEHLNELTKSGGFAFSLGVHFSSYQRLKAKEFDKKYVPYCLDNQSSSTKEIVGKLKQRFPVVWLGVTGQKRELVEQVEAYRKIIKKVTDIFPSSAVVFDGWTSQISYQKQDAVEAEADRAVTVKITENLDFLPLIIDAIGMTSKEKVCIASHCHFFVANHGTGSLHISRFAKKKGLTHLSNVFFKSHGHEPIHWNAIKYPGSLTEDEPGGTRQDMISYHVDPDMFADHFIEMILNTKNAPAPVDMALSAKLSKEA